MRSAVVSGNGLIHGLFQRIRKTIDQKTQLLLNPPVKPLNFTPSLRMVGGAKNVFYTVLAQIPARSFDVKPEPLSE